MAKELCQKRKRQWIVVGVSGGVDSAVTSTLCAMTGMEVMCLEMPIHQAESHVSRAQEHIEQLKKRFPKCNSHALILTPVFDSFKTEINLESNSSTVDMALQIPERVYE